MHKKHRRRFAALLLCLALLIGAGVGVYQWLFSPLALFECELDLGCALAKCAELLQDEAMKATLRKKLRAFPRVRVEGDVLMLLPYLSLCHTLSLPYDGAEIANALLASYDAEQRLFTLEDKDQGLSTTLMLIGEFPEILGFSQFDLERGVQDALTSLAWRLPEEGYSFYASGGIAFTAIERMRLAGGDTLEDLLPADIDAWYAAWRAHFAERGQVFDSAFFCASLYMEGSCPTYDAEAYYLSLDPTVLERQEHFQIERYHEVLRLVRDPAANPAFFSFFCTRVEEMIESYTFIRRD